MSSQGWNMKIAKTRIVSEHHYVKIFLEGFMLSYLREIILFYLLYFINFVPKCCDRIVIH